MTVARHVPLTHAQTTFWAAQQLYPDAPLYNAPHAFNLPEDLCPDAFRKAFEALVVERDVLRLVIDTENGTPRQRVLPRVGNCIAFVDLGASNSDLEDWLTDRVRRSFDLTRPLFDSVLLKTGAEEFIWFFNQHHLITDAWSTGVLFRRLSALYGEATPDPGAPSYLDYVTHERAIHEAPEWEAARSYWTDKLNRSAPPSAFYGVHNQRLPFQIARIDRPLGPDRSAALREAATRGDFFHKALRVTMANMLLAALVAYLERITGDNTFTVGLPHHNRTTEAFRQTAGVMLEVLPVRIPVEPDDTFLALVSRVHREAGSCMSHRPFLHEGQERSYGVLFNYHVASFPEFDGRPITQRLFHPGVGVEPMVLHVHDFGGTGELTLSFDFDTETFSERQRERAVGHFLRLLDGCLARPDVPVRGIDLLSSTERTDLLANVNRSSHEFDGDACLHHLFERQAAETPDATAAVDADSTLTYRELDERANRIAHHLQGIGVAPETLVGLCLERTTDLVAATLGILKAGGAFLPLDSEYPKERLAFMCADAQLEHVVTSSRLADRLPAIPGAIVAIDNDADQIHAAPAASCNANAQPRDLAYVIYTSGSTGRPKGTLLEHRGVVGFTAWLQRFFQLGPNDAVLQFGSVSFDAYVLEVCWALASGASLHLAPREILADPHALAGLIQERGITAACMPPTMLRTLDPDQVPSLVHLVSGGEACEVQLARAWAPGRRFYNAYGPAENTVCTTIYACSGGESGTVPIGRPMASSHVYVLDDRQMPCPVGVPGELYVAGVGLARGYLNRPEVTAQRFVANPFSEVAGERMYRTGDRVRLREDGLLEFVGRLDFQVKIRGQRVELEEIERAMGAHAGVRACAVGVDETPDGTKRLVVYVEDSEDAVGDPVLRSHLRKRLPDYMIPSQFVRLEHLPVTANGKVDRDSLPALQGSADADVEMVQPRTPLEQYLAGLWREVLGVDALCVHSNFFEVGGDSIKAATLMNRLGDDLEETTQIAALFDAPTVAELAAYLEQHYGGALYRLCPGADAGVGAGGGERVGTAPKASWRPLVRIRGGHERLPFFCVHPAGGHIFTYFHLAHHLGAGHPFYALQDPSLGGEREPLDSIEAIASEYVDAMIDAQPDGPYRVGGWSFGGYVAYEMARQLHEQGRDVSLLALFDTPVPARPNGRASLSDRFAKARENVRLHMAMPYYSLPLIKDILFLLARLKKGGHANGAGPVTRATRAVLSALVRKAEMANVVAGNARLLLIPQAPLLRTYSLLKWHGKILDRYEVQPYPGRVTLFRADKTMFRIQDPNDETLGWAEMAGGGVDVRRVPGNHFVLLTKPYVEALASALHGCLEASGEEPRRPGPLSDAARIVSRTLSARGYVPG
ncbi:MAG: amino acid adenylation domain-containing protein, partial [bacterium]|nr:amino acid adenylation domain-containing protein [bacterium]